MAFITFNNQLTYEEAEKRVIGLLETHLVPRAYARRGIKGAALWLYKNFILDDRTYCVIMGTK